MNYSAETEEVEGVLKEYLGASEVIKSILVVQSMTSPEDDVPTPTSSQETQVLVLAVVSSFADAGEEGSIFVFKPFLTKDQSEEPDPEPHYLLLVTLPLTNVLSIAVAQSRDRSGTIDLRPAFLLTLDYLRQKWTFSAKSSDELRVFVSECRRLINVANASSHLDFRWLSKYQTRPDPQVPTLFPRPDLRKIQTPAYLNLSSASAGQSGDEDADIELIRAEWACGKLDQDKGVFTGEREIRIRLGTFNVNGKTPSQDLAPWIRPQHIKTSNQPSLPPIKSISPISLSSLTAPDYISAKSDEFPASGSDAISGTDSDPDIIVLGFQELDLSTEALLYSYTTTREQMWLEAIFAALGEKRDQYTKLISKQLVGMLIICIVKNDLVKYISDVKTCAVGTGIMGTMGNKGAVAIRLTLDSTVLSFVNAHLAAFDEYTEKRNSDFHDLSRRLSFAPETEESNSEDMLDVNSEIIFQSDALFWMVVREVSMNLSSDLNYRIDLPDVEVRQLISGGVSTRNYDIRDLLSHDQLTKARLGGKAFEDFKEGEISHYPSYRFSAGVATDSNGYDMKRRPAWTDRILYLIAPHTRLYQTKYTAHHELTMSDHKPVSADFRVTVREADGSTYQEKAQKLFESLGDMEESETTPRLKVLSSEIQFGRVWHKRKKTQTLVLQNTGKVPCAYRFVSLSEGKPTFPRWLSVEPCMGMILPNEEISILLAVYVDDASARMLNVGEAELQHTLILHTVRGKDNFVVVTGDYQRTCFANDLGDLVRLPGPIREGLVTTESRAKKPKANAPRELVRLINWLMSNATDIPDLFVSPGVPQIIDSIRESLDTGEEFDSDLRNKPEAERRALALSCADALLQFLQSLPSPIVPAALQQRCAQVADRDEAFEVVSSELPGFILNAWISLTAFLHYIAQKKNSDEEKPNEYSKAAVLACIFAPVLLRDEPGSTNPISPLAKRRFVLHFIQ